MKFAIIFCVVALASLVCSQPLSDTLQESHRPSPPVKSPPQPPVINPTPQWLQPNPEDMEIANVRPEMPEIIVNIIANVNHKPEVDYYNGKVVPTPKYSTN